MKFDGFLYDALPKGPIKSAISSMESKWQNWNDDTIMAFLYVLLGKEHAMDKYYRYGNEEEKRTTETKAHEEKDPMQKLNTHREVICVDLARGLSDLASVFGISCKMVLDNGGPHVYNIYGSPNVRKRLDLQEDLYNIQSGRSLEHFGIEYCHDGSYFTVYSPQELEKILETILETIEYEITPKTDLQKCCEMLKKQCVPLDQQVSLLLYAISSTYGKQLQRMGFCEKIELFKNCLKEFIVLPKGKRIFNFNQSSPISHKTVRDGNNFVSTFLVVDTNGNTIRFFCNNDSIKYQSVLEKVREADI